MTTDLSMDAMAARVAVDTARYGRLPDDAMIARTAEAMRARGLRVDVVKGRAQALEAVRARIPPGAEVMHGSSTTLIEIGFLALLAGAHPWKSLWDQIRAANDEAARGELRRRSVCAEWYLAGANAVAETGEVMLADRSGNRVSALAFAAKNVIVVVGANKIVPTVADGVARIQDFVFPLENERAQEAYKTKSAIGKMLVYAQEAFPGRTSVVLVEERLGY